jgi:hypothetical protein
MPNRVDAFNRADGSIGTPSDGGSAWEILSGTWTVSGNQARETSGGNQMHAVLESGLADCDVEGTISAQGSAADDGLCWRASNDSNLFIIGGSTGQVYKREAGGFAAQGSAFGAISASTVVRISLAANVHTIYYNGTLKGSVTSAFNNGATKHGLRAFSSGGVARWDNFSITAPGGVVTTTTGLEAAILASQQATATLNAAISANRFAAPALDGGVSVAQAAIGSLTAALQSARVVNAGVDAAVESLRSGGATFDGVAQRALTISANLDAVARQALSVAGQIDAYVLGGGTQVQASLDTAVRAARSASATLDGVIGMGLTAGASTDGIVRYSGTSAAALDAALRQAGAAVSALDAVIQGALFSTSAAMDAGIAASFTRGALVDAALRRVATGVSAIDAVVANAAGLRVRLSAIRDFLRFGVTVGNRQQI